MVEVTLIDFSYLNRLAPLTFIEVGPQFSNQDSSLGPVIEKSKKLSTLQYQRSICVTAAILIQSFRQRNAHVIFIFKVTSLQSPRGRE